MRCFPLLAFTAFSAALPTAAHAGDSQVWATATAQVGLGGKWRAHNELVVRDSDGRGFYEVEENLMVGYKADKHVTLWLGYTFNPLYNHGSHLITEQRFRQQVNLDNVLALGPVRLGGRVRLEERWRPGFGGAAWRLRPQVKASLPIHGKTVLSASHESFIDLNTNAFQRVAGEERMRNAVAISTPLSKRFTAEVGYLEQHGFSRTGRDTHDHVLTLGLSANF